MILAKVILDILGTKYGTFEYEGRLGLFKDDHNYVSIVDTMVDSVIHGLNSVERKERVL